VKFGLAIMNDFPPGTVPAQQVALLREQVQVAGGAGIESIWVLQHYLGNMPTLQPLQLLSALAADSGQLMLGTNMLILPLAHPVAVAEDFATLDHISDGRVLAGLGLGYRENEFESFGIPLADRVGRYEESIEIIRALWSGDEVSFAGQHFALARQRISLKPVQPGGPRIWIGAGAHRTGARRAARLGDAWMVPPHVDPARLATVLEWYRAERQALGRPPADEIAVRRELLLDEDADQARELGQAARGALSRQYGQFNAPDQTGTYRHLDSDTAAREVADQSYLFTDPDRAVASLRALEAAGVTYVVLRMQWYNLPHKQVLRTLELFRNHVAPAFPP